jgi:hypothetical protein
MMGDLRVDAERAGLEEVVTVSSCCSLVLITLT